MDKRTQGLEFQERKRPQELIQRSGAGQRESRHVNTQKWGEGPRVRGATSTQAEAGDRGAWQDFP